MALGLQPVAIQYAARSVAIRNSKVFAYRARFCERLLEPLFVRAQRLAFVEQD